MRVESVTQSIGSRPVAGEIVYALLSAGAFFGRGDASHVYKITQLLPSESDDFQYRIKYAGEPHERVVKESQLDRAA